MISRKVSSAEPGSSLDERFPYAYVYEPPRREHLSDAEVIACARGEDAVPVVGRLRTHTLHCEACAGRVRGVAP